MGNLNELITALKTSNIREWHRPEIIKGITDAIRITCKIHTLQQAGEVTLIKKDTQAIKNQDDHPMLEKPKAKRGRPKGKKTLDKAQKDIKSYIQNWKSKAGPNRNT